ncbi:MAG: MATE family efflux transporter [Pseudomonadota bacterium]
MSSRDLTQGSIPGHLARLGVPMVAAVAALISVALADAYFLGQLGTAELAAISFAFPVLLTVNSIGIGLSAGAASVASRAIGKGDQTNTKRLATDSLLLATALLSIVSVIGWFFCRDLFVLLGAEGVVLDHIVDYMKIWFVGVPLFIVPMVAMGLIRANGDSVAPSVIMVIASIVNIILDPIFIYGTGPIPELGVAGAAWATLGSRLVSLVFVVPLLVFREKLLTFVLPTMPEFTASASQVLRVGIPAAGSNMINPLSISIVTAFLASYGNEAVAAFGVASRVETLATIPMLALSSAIGPVAGQNWGRGLKDRTIATVKSAFVFVVACGLILGAVFYGIAGPATAIFTDDPDVQRWAGLYLVIVGVTLGGYGVVINASAAYNAIDKANLGLGFTVIRSLVLYVPLVALAVSFGPLIYVFAAIAVTNIIAGLSVGFLTLRILHRERCVAKGTA